MTAPLRSLTGYALLDSAVLLITVYLAWSIKSWWRLRHIPGPRLAGWSVIPLFLLHVSGKQYEGFKDLSKKYGPIVRIAPKTIMISDPGLLRKMSAARSPFTRSGFYTAFRLYPGKDNVFSQRNEKLHDEMRRKMAAGYSGKESPTLEPDIDGCVRDLIRLLGSYASTGSGKVFDLGEKIQFFTTDTISKVAFDFKFNDLRDDNDNFGYIKQVTDLFLNIYGVVAIPGVLDFLTNIGFMQRFAPSLHDEFGLGKIFAVSKAQVAKRYGTQENSIPEIKRDDMLGSLIKHGLKQAEAEQESLVQLAAGSDTVAGSLRTILLCIMANPRVHAKLIAEIDAAKASYTSSADHDSEQIVSNETTMTLQYLQACIKEGMRWFPPVAGMMGKVTPPGGYEMFGHNIPAGVAVARCVYSLHHNPDLYGPDEDIFRPERWIHVSEGGDEESAEKLKALEQNHELHFGTGKYQCLGKNVAAIELNKVVFEVFNRFHLALANPAEGIVSICVSVWIQKNFLVTIRRRS